MSIAELFLLAWAGIATFLAVMYKTFFVRAIKERAAVVDLLGEVCLGEVKPTITHEGNGFAVENDTIKLGGVRRKYADQ